MDYNRYTRLFDSVCERMGGISVFSNEVGSIKKNGVLVTGDGGTIGFSYNDYCYDFVENNLTNAMSLFAEIHDGYLNAANRLYNSPLLKDCRVDYMPEYMPVNLLFGLDCNERVREAGYIAITCDIVEFFANNLYYYKTKVIENE